MRLALAVLAWLLSGPAASEPALALGVPGSLPEAPPIVSGKASFYGAGFGGRRTASGEAYQHHIISAASNRFSLGTLVAVRRVLSARCVVVKINDRMGHRKRVIDLSREAAVRLGMLDAGVVEVQVAPLPKYLMGHEDACSLAFQPPVRLHVDGGQGLVSAGK